MPITGPDGGSVGKKGKDLRSVPESPRPGHSSSGSDPVLRPEMPVRQAMTAVYRGLLETMRRNEPGPADDPDPEHLHDFRVAVRRTRSGLGQLPDALPRAVTRRFSRGFSWLGDITGPTRDLDVFLLRENRMESHLPERLQKGLPFVFAELGKRRAVEWKKLAGQVMSARYRKIITAWQAFLDADQPGDESGGSSRPIIDHAREIILRSFGKVIREGQGIAHLSPPEKLHRLRIRCKKLRYLLEFFAPLFSGKDVDRAIRHLKRLQDNLGDFNDLAVQQAMLRQYLDGLRLHTRHELEMAACLGGMLTVLHREQQQVRAQFEERFREFSRPANIALYARLAGKQGPTGSGQRERNE